MNRSMRARQSGFSLLEVLVAFVILSVSIGVLLQAFAQGLRGTSIAREYTLAALHAESILAAVGVEEPIEQGGFTQGEIDDTYHWSVEIEEYFWPDATDDPEGLKAVARVTPYRVVVTVSWPASVDRDRAVTLETLRLVPEDGLR